MLAVHMRYVTTKKNKHCGKIRWNAIGMLLNGNKHIDAMFVAVGHEFCSRLSSASLIVLAYSFIVYRLLQFI